MKNNFLFCSQSKAHSLVKLYIYIVRPIDGIYWNVEPNKQAFNLRE